MSIDADLRRGAEGERVVIDVLLHNPNIKTFLDVRDDKKFQTFDVDFLIQLQDRQVRWVEVKTDFYAHISGNIPYEVISSSTYNTKGCFEKTKADLIFFYIHETGELYQIAVEMLRYYVKSSNLPLVKMGDNAKGHLISIEDLVSRGIMTEVKR